MKTNGKENVPKLTTVESVDQATFEDSQTAYEQVKIKKPKTQHYSKSKESQFQSLQHLRLIKQPFELMVPEDEQSPSQKQDESQISEAQIMNNLFYMEPSRRPVLYKTKSGDVHHKTMTYQCIGQSGSNS